MTSSGEQLQNSQEVNNLPRLSLIIPAHNEQDYHLYQVVGKLGLLCLGFHSLYILRAEFKEKLINISHNIRDHMHHPSIQYHHHANQEILLDLAYDCDVVICQILVCVVYLQQQTDHDLLRYLIFSFSHIKTML